MERLIWDAHVCLPISVDTDVGDLLAYRAAGVGFLSLNIGMCMNPVEQIDPVIAHFTQAIEATDGLKLVASVDDLTPGVTGVAFDLEGARPLRGRAEGRRRNRGEGRGGHGGQRPTPSRRGA